MEHYIMIIILIIGAGLLGGITNYFRIEQEKRDLFSFLKNVFMGISGVIGVKSLHLLNRVIVPFSTFSR
jgi:UDP-N-acetylmuramyl pentapeptide phosphotransferase/UDP-N-acetylglucosamine-1-phosphate transferase